MNTTSLIQQLNGYTHNYLGRKQRAAVDDLGVDGVTSDPVTLTYVDTTRVGSWSNTMFTLYL